MRMDLTHIKEPELIFGGGNRHIDPKEGLANSGPISSSNSDVVSVPIGLVTTSAQLTSIVEWLDRLGTLQVDSERNALKFPEYPGSQQAFRVSFELDQRFLRTISASSLELALGAPDSSRIDAVLDLYIEAIASLFVDAGPKCVVVYFPESVASLRGYNPKLSMAEQTLLNQMQEDDSNQQMSLFDNFTAEERQAAAELFPQAEELLFRTLYRALKARCMMLPNAVPTQVIRDHTYTEAATAQGPATKAWNFGTAMFYKSTGIPWRPAELAPGTCYLGVSFQHLKRRGGDLVYASLAQAMSSETEPFALQGATIARDQRRGKQPYLMAEQAESLIKQVLRQYEVLTGTRPNRVVVHKTSTYQPEEIEGIESGLSNHVPLKDLVWFRPTGLRLIRKGKIEPERGTLIRIEGKRTYLYTTGYISWWQEYPGPHIPAPLEFGHIGEADISGVASDILALTKMNWNSADGIGRHPITLSFARQVGTIMTELDDIGGEEPPKINPLYRFYM